MPPTSAPRGRVPVPAIFLPTKASGVGVAARPGPKLAAAHGYVE
jgi:hypothetical protein